LPFINASRLLLKSVNLDVCVGGERGSTIKVGCISSYFFLDLSIREKAHKLPILFGALPRDFI
jgi:hypothetical protein